jgi:hypothetical protein
MAQCTSLNKEVQVCTNLPAPDPCSWHRYLSSGCHG